VCCQDNLRAALAWSRRASVGSAGEVGLRLAAALCWFWNLRGEVSEGLEWVEAALARGRDAAPTLRAQALTCLMYAAGQAHVYREACVRVMTEIAEGRPAAAIDTESNQERLYRYGALRRAAT
jgi:hypothetical protein